MRVRSNPFSRGFSFIEMLILIAIIGIICAIVIPSWLRAKAAARFDPFKRAFGVELPLEPTDTTTKLTPEQRAVLRPLVTAKLAQICAPVPKKIDVAELAPSTDPAEVKRRLQVLADYEVAVHQATYDCAQAREIANREGIVPQ